MFAKLLLGGAIASTLLLKESQKK